MVNDELFIDTLVQIEREPQHWAQYTFECAIDEPIDFTTHHLDCGTARCFGGWALVLSGQSAVQGDSWARRTTPGRVPPNCSGSTQR